MDLKQLHRTTRADPDVLDWWPEEAIEFKKILPIQEDHAYRGKNSILYVGVEVTQGINEVRGDSPGFLRFHEDGLQDLWCVLLQVIECSEGD